MNTPSQTPVNTGKTITVKTPSTVSVSTVSIAITAALVWVIQTYVIHGQLPGPLTVALYSVVPAVVGGLFTRYALNQMPPKLDAAIAARWDKKFHVQQGTMVVAKPPVSAPPQSLSDIYGSIPLTAENPTGKDDNPYQPGGAA